MHKLLNEQPLRMTLNKSVKQIVRPNKPCGAHKH